MTHEPMTIGVWTLFGLAILAFIAFDLGIWHKKPRPLSMGEALSWTLFWIFTALAFNVLVHFMYEEDGPEAALQFFTGYVLEKSLSLDNIFIISIIFAYFHVPLAYQHRVLTWGVIGALVMRLIMILAGTALITRFSWMMYVFGALLIYTAFRMLFAKETTELQRNIAIDLAKKFFPVTHEFHQDHFFVRINGVLMVTPLFITLLQVETADLLFALDSIPAIFAVTSDPFIIFTSNVFAVLGLRSLYFVLAGMIQHLRFLKLSLVIVLAYVGVKMLLAHLYPIPLLLSLLVIIGVLVAGAIASLVLPPLAPGETPPPLSKDIEALAMMSWQQAKRIVTLLAGITLLLIGLAMIVLPGPAILFIPLGLATLAREFVWAKNLLKEMRQGTSHFFKSEENNHKK